MTETIVQVVSFKIKHDREAEALALIADTVKYVEANEPGVQLYGFVRSPDDPLRIFVFELYKDKATLDAHNAYIATVAPKMMELFEMSTFGTPPPVAGFVR
jgi:quinol monooxygenase YgiN